ncbi:MAG: fatty acid desaturase [bacterium]
MFEKAEYIFEDSPNPHWVRMKKIAADHPEVKGLFGNTPSTAVYTALLVFFQVGIGLLLRDRPVWLILLLSYIIGAVANHALFVIIHECTHHLVFKNPVANKLLSIFANFPQFFPSAISFSKYHMLHHSNQSEFDYDPDIAGPGEARWIGNSAFRKTLFLAFFGLIQGFVRPARLKKVKFFEGWFVFNFLIQMAFLFTFLYFFGYKPLLYFFLSTFFGLGLHPLGGRWIQEHYVTYQNQETYSYYGPLNKLCFNMGYHNEHHDFMKVPWSRLPRLRSLAPEHYDALHSYSSWTRLIFRFIIDPEITLFRRIVRPSRGAMAASGAKTEKECRQENFEPGTQPVLS